MNLTRPLVCIDIESTGVDPCADRIVEFGAILIHVDGKRRQFVQRFNPTIPIPAEAAAIHGITDADVKDCPTFASWAPRLLKALDDRDLAGYNLRRLDLPILDEELRRNGLKLDLTGRLILDAFGIFSKKEPRKLEDAVRRYCGREHQGAHGAGHDAVATADVLRGQLEAYPDLKAMQFAELAAFSKIDDKDYADIAAKLYRDKDGDLCFAFGKNRGHKVADELNYADWMLSKGQFPGSTLEALEAELERLRLRTVHAKEHA